MKNPNTLTHAPPATPSVSSIPKMTSELSLDDFELHTLLYEFKTQSKYGELWLRLKYTGFITVSYNPLFKHQHRIIAKALNNLFCMDDYFKQWCLFQYDALPIFKSSDNKEKCELTVRLDYTQLTSKQFE